MRSIYRTGVPLPSRCCILYIFFNKYKYWVFWTCCTFSIFSLQNAVYFIMLPFLVQVLFTFYIQSVPLLTTPGSFSTLRTVRRIYRTGVPLPSKCSILYMLSTNISTEYFKHAAHSLFFSSKCRLFHNATFFGSCIIHILHTGCAKI